MKIRVHLALMAGAVLIPVTVFSGYAISLLIGDEREAMLAAMEQTAQATSAAIDGELNRADGVVRALAASQALQAGDFRSFYEQARAANAGRQSHVTLFDGAGDRILTTVVPYGSPLARLPEPNRVRARQVMDASQPQVSNLVHGKVTGQYLLAVELPVGAADGRRYLISEWNYANHFRTLLGNKDVPKSWLIAVFDRAGDTIVRSSGPDTFIGKPPRDDLLAAIRNPETTRIRNTSRDGVALYSVLARSPVSGWTVAVGAPVEEIERSAKRAAAMAVAGFLAAVAAALVAAFLFAARLMRALDLTLAGARALRGNGTPPAGNAGIAEVDALLIDLRHTASALASAQAERDRLLQEAERGRAVAEAQNRAKDEFLAMLGHELRNPLGAISAGIDILEMEAAGPAAQRRAQEIVARQCRNLNHIVDELLDASRLLNGKVTLSPTAVDLAEAARAALAALRLRHATPREVELHTEPAWIDADPTRLDQMIGNLLENAFKYTPEGGRIALRVAVQGDSAVLTVQDTGIGIAPEVLPTIFDMFVQAPTPNRTKGGLGIGLAVVRALAQQHRAELSAASEGIGKGSTFTVRFPLARVQAATPSAAAPAMLPAPALQLVLIDDNDDGRAMLAALLAARGITVLQAATGEEGIRLVTQARPPVALVDIDLPDMRGHDVAAHLRAAFGQDIRLVAISGFGQDSDRAEALAAGFDRHMKKPVDVERLLDAIHAWVAH